MAGIAFFLIVFLTGDFILACLVALAVAGIGSTAGSLERGGSDTDYISRGL